MWPFLADPPSFIQLGALIACVLMGLSHIVQPQLWVDYFTRLHAEGTPGLVSKTMSIELWPALLVVSLHQVWSGPAIILTIYGWAQLAKVAIAVLVPRLGMRSLAMAQRGPRAFVVAGFLLIGIGVSAGLALVWN